jgi:hypothetical protein
MVVVDARGRTVGNLHRNALGILLIPAAFAFAHEAYPLLTENLGSLISNWFVFGALAFLGVALITPAETIGFIEILEHELAHTIVAYAFLQNVRKLTVEANGRVEGFVQGPSSSNFVIVLAPYFLPLFTIPLIIVKPFISSTVHNVIDFLIGFTLAFHFYGLYAEFRPRNQKDIQITGLVLSFVMTLLLNVIFLVIIFCSVLNEYPHIPKYLEDSFARTITTYQTVIQEVRRQIGV